MTNEEINEVMAQEIVDLLKKHHIFNKTMLFYNNKLLQMNDETKEVVIENNVDVREYTKFCNPDMITIVYEGKDSLYFVANGYPKVVKTPEEVVKANKITYKLIKISDRYDRWFNLASDNCMYFASNDEDAFTVKDTYDFSEE